MKPIKPHALVTALLPPLSGEEINRAAERVRLYGQRERIELLGTAIISGYLEYLACKRARVKPHLRNVAEPDPLIEYIVRRNVPRHLSTLDRGCIAVLAQTAHKELARERMREAGRIGGGLKGKGRGVDPRPFEGARWFETAAKMVGTTAGAVRRLAHIQTNAPDVFEAVRARRITTLREARELALRVKEPRERVELIERYESNGKTTPIMNLVYEHERRVRRAQLPDALLKGARYVLHTGPMAREASKIADRTVDLVHADVVYGDVSMVEEVARIAARVLVDGGVLALIAGNEQVRDVVNAACAHLNMVTIGAMLLPASKRPLRGGGVRRVDAVPVYLLSKGTRPKRPIEHIAFTAVGPIEKTHHTWEKPLSAVLDLVAATAEPGSVVLDPCCGSGTTGVAALKHGCRFIGVEVDLETVLTAAARLAETERELGARPTLKLVTKRPAKAAGQHPTARKSA